MADHDTHDHTGVPGVGTPADILDIPTAETDTSLVLAPDGAGGVEFRAETGGGGGAQVWLARRTASGGASLDFASLISSTYETYVFEMQQVRPATDAVKMYLRVGTGGGPTYDSSGIYTWASWRYVNAGSAAAGANSGTYIGLDGEGVMDNGANSSMSGTVKLYNPGGGVLFPRFTWKVQYVENASTAMIACDGGGRYDSTTAVTAIQFLASSGNLTSGVIDMYGLTHA